MKRIEVPKFDVTPYIGTSAEIVKAEVQQSKFGKMIKVETNPIPLKDGDTLPEGKLLRASVLLGLIENDDGSLAIGIDSKADKFCKAHKVDISSIPDNLQVGDLIKAFEGKKVKCQKSTNGFLEIA